MCSGWKGVSERGGMREGEGNFSSISMGLNPVCPPFCHLYTSWSCTRKIAGAGLRRFIGKVKAVPKVSEHKFHQ